MGRGLFTSLADGGPDGFKQGSLGCQAMFDQVLVANRGEIAARIVRTLHAHGVRAVTVHADDDVGQPHTRLADRSVSLGRGPPVATYLDVDRIVELAVQTGCEAIHPGYGFLSEDPRLAEATAAAGLTWIGPPPKALELLGDKARALELADELGIPTTPGSDGALPTLEAAREALKRTGTPAVLKAVRGGGGMGMVRIDDPSQLGTAWEDARSQAAAAFGSPEVLLERWWAQPRHVEVQIAMDQDGDGVHLFERECSLQRRHQKLVEEGPAPCVDEALRAELTRDALAIGEAAGVVNLATVEFLVTGEGYVFNEVNPRLQVEHPVTEAITGEDLVAWQLQLAAGESLSKRQDELAMDGWAMEARVNVENPLDAFTPAPGPVSHVHVPTGPGLRVDHALVPGGQVPAQYDSLVAKIIAHGPDRATALARCRAGLAELRVGSRPTTAGLLHHVLGLESVQAGQLHTGLIDEAVIASYRRIVHGAMAAFVDRWAASQEGRVSMDGVEASWARTDHGVEIAGKATEPVGEVLDRARVQVGERVLEGRLHAAIARSAGASLAGEHVVESPIPGTVAQTPVQAGDRVEQGDTVAVVEAMKMKNRIGAPGAGEIAEVLVREGQNVDHGAPLVRITID